MTTRVVLDASVVVKLVVMEPLSVEARALVTDAARMDRGISAPVLLESEVTNALYQQERRGALSRTAVDDALALFLALPITFISDDALYSDALHYARRHQLGATYDCQYVLVAERLDADLWTADLKFVRSLGRAARRIRWIGDYAPAG